MKKFSYCIALTICMWMWFVWAQSISLLPQWDGNFWKNCVVPIDVFVDTAGQEISAMDLMFETSLQYKDFVPTELFPYFFPPIINDKWQVHIVWFTVDPSERLNWSGKIGTLYFNQKNNAIDGVVRLYFLKEWDTTDTNLSMAWWIDALKEILGAYVVFSDELEPCETVEVDEDATDAVEESASETIISWGFAEKTQDEIFQETFEKIEAKYGENTWITVKNIWYVVVLFVLLLLIILLLIYKNILSSEKESGKWKSKQKYKRK